jgi:hypothetical protein
VKISNKTLKVSTGLPDWKAYVEFINSIVVGGLTRVASSSLKLLLERTEIPDHAMIDSDDDNDNDDESETEEKKKKKKQPKKNHVDPLMDADLSLSADGRVALTPGLFIPGPTIRDGQARRLNKIGGTLQKIVAFWIGECFFFLLFSSFLFSSFFFFFFSSFFFFFLIFFFFFNKLIKTSYSKL